MEDSLKFQLELVDRMTKPGQEAAAQMKKLSLQLKASMQAVKQTEQAMAKLQRAKVVDIASYKQLNNQLQHQKSAVEGFRSAILGVAKPLGDQSGDMESAVMKGTLLGNVYTKLGEVALEAGRKILEIGVGGFELALHANELKNDTLDALEAFMGSADAAKETYQYIEDIQGSVAISQERGMALARELTANGVTNKDALQDAIKSIGEVSSVLGEGTGSRIQSIIERSTAGGKFEISTRMLRGTGINTDAIAQAMGISPKQLEAQMKAGKVTAEAGIAALTKAVHAKFAGPASKQVLDIGNQFQHLKDNFGKLFEDVDTGGFLSQLHEILSVFDQNTVAGQALKYVVTTIFDGLFKVVEAVGPFVKTFMKGLVIIALQAYIAFKPLIAAISEAFGGDKQSAVDGLAGGMSAIGQAVGYVVSQFVQFVQQGIAVVQWFLSIEAFLISLPMKFFNAGAAIVTGLIDGIKSMASAPVDALRNMATGALDAFKGVFGIHSPSKVMGQMGGHLMGGLEQGIDKHSTGAQDAMQSAVAPPQVGGGGGGGGSSSSVEVTVAPGAIVINGVQSAQQVAELLPEMLANVMENIMLEKGVAA